VHSFGIRIAQPLLDVTSLSDDVEIVSSPGLLTITPSVHLGAGWVEAAAACDAHGLLDEITATRVAPRPTRGAQIRTTRLCLVVSPDEFDRYGFSRKETF
jgi:hypothetical protein